MASSDTPAPAARPARRPQHLREGPHPVGVALLLAQHPVQPGGERAAQAVRAEHLGGPHPVVPVGADPADEQLRLDGAGPVHDHHPAGVVGGDRRARARLGRRRRSIAPSVSASSASRSTPVRSPTTTAVAVAGRTCALVEGAYGRRVDPARRSPRCPGAAGTCRADGREQLLGQLLGRAPGRVGQSRAGSRRDGCAPAARPRSSAKAGARSASASRPSAFGEPRDGHLQRDAARRGGRRARRAWRRSAPARRRTPRRSACRCPRTGRAP